MFLRADSMGRPKDKLARKMDSAHVQRKENHKCWRLFKYAEPQPFAVSFSIGLMYFTEQGCRCSTEIQALPDYFKVVIHGNRSASNKVSEMEEMWFPFLWNLLFGSHTGLFKYAALGTKTFCQPGSKQSVYWKIICYLHLEETVVQCFSCWISMWRCGRTDQRWSLSALHAC